MPCVRLAEEGSRFCSRHARAIEGAVLGALMHAEVRDEAVTLYEEKPLRSGRRGKGRVRRRALTARCEVGLGKPSGLKA